MECFQAAYETIKSMLCELNSSSVVLHITLGSSHVDVTKL